MPAYPTPPTLEALDAFFGVASDPPAEAAHWPYTEARYRRAGPDWALEATIAPAALDIALSLRVGGRLVYELRGLQVERLSVEPGPAHATLRIDFPHGGALHLRLDPEPAIFHAHDGHL